MNVVARRSRALAAALLGLLLCFVTGATAKTIYVAPNVTSGISLEDEQYLIGVISFAVLVLALYMGVKSMTDIYYEDDTLLMVEVPEDNAHDE